jgi:large subunit ribosomal protein L19
MSKAAAIQKLESKYTKKDIPYFRVGDTVRVHTRIIEGEKERVQAFMGTVIARTGSGLSETVSLHRVAYGEGMERVFPIHSPRIAKIEVMKEGKVRRAKLYYLRGTSGKKAKVRGLVGTRRGGNGSVEAKQAGQEEQQEGIREEDAVAMASEQATEEVKTEKAPSKSASHGKKNKDESSAS